MKKIFRGLAVVCVTILFGLMLLGSGSSEKSEKVGEVADSEKSGDGETAEIKDIYQVGDIVSAKGLEIIYVASGDYISDSQFFQPKEGNKYIYIDLAAENKSESDKSVSYFSFECYADGYKAEQYFGNDDTFSATLSPGRRTSGRIIFEVPQEAQNIEIEYEDNFFSDHKIKFAFEGEKSSGYVPAPDTSHTEGAYKVGDIVDTGKKKISFLSAEPMKNDNMFTSPPEGCEYIACEFEFENTSDSDQVVSSLVNFSCFADGAKCEQHVLLDGGLDGTVSAGRKIKGKVAFAVPTAAEAVELEYVDNIVTSDRVVFIVR